MDLDEASPYIIPDQNLCMLHRDRRRLSPPGIGAEMISAKDQPLKRQPRRSYDLLHKFAKSSRPHSRVAAELIDLITGSLNQQKSTGGHSLLRCRTKNQRMCGAHRVDAPSVGQARS